MATPSCSRPIEDARNAPAGVPPATERARSEVSEGSARSLSEEAHMESISFVSIGRDLVLREGEDGVRGLGGTPAVG